jgi:lysophospholipid acyltransferase (LPLAT)-like uncharacterized protein
MKLRHPQLLRLLPPLAKSIMNGVYRSCRKVIVNLEAETQLAAQGRPILYTCWHGQLAYVSCTFPYRPRPIVLLASPSFDGELISRVAEKFGARVFFGSRNKGGLAALKQIARCMRQGNYGGIIADGSRGPYHHLHKGVVMLARDAGSPIIPVAVASERKFVFNSWDRFELTLPFSRVALLYGEPFEIPPDVRSKNLEAFRLQLETKLRKLFDLSQINFS